MEGFDRGGQRKTGIKCRRWNAVDSKDKLEALKLALTNEEKERDFYLAHARRTKDALGRQMFESIAADENEHYRRLVELHKKLAERSKWPAAFSLDIPTRVADALGRLVKEATSSPQSDADDVAAVKAAIEFEHKGEAFYEKLAAQAKDKPEKRFFTLLASMEREHRLSLEDTLEYFTDPSGWMERKEGRHLDGA
ncbi:MAG: ferritin family protein [Candidatus Krumholzibacteria bacterium]|nr:ferritin family protein [Candidatus Krumholzibacteria bacterium]